MRSTLQKTRKKDKPHLYRKKRLSRMRSTKIGDLQGTRRIMSRITRKGVAQNVERPRSESSNSPAGKALQKGYVAKVRGSHEKKPICLSALFRCPCPDPKCQLGHSARYISCLHPTTYPTSRSEGCLHFSRTPNLLLNIYSCACKT